MARTMTARFRGSCRTCWGAILPGNDVVHNGRGNTSHAECVKTFAEKITEGHFSEPDLVRIEGDNRPFARTRNGLRAGFEHTGVRCEDAPCCGCC